MKKRIVLCVCTIALALLAACGKSASPLKAIEGATDEQIAAIQTVLDEVGVVPETCEKVTIEASGNELQDDITNSLLEVYTPYSITTAEGKTYRVVINKEDYSVFTITDPDGESIYGGLSGLWGD